MYKNKEDQRAWNRDYQRMRYAQDEEFRAKRKTDIKNRRSDVLSVTYASCRLGSAKAKAVIRGHVPPLINSRDLNVLFTFHDGCCDLCGEFKGIRKLCLDHNHQTGKVRGLICDSCNRGLGFFRDDVNKLNNAIRYLNDHNS